MINAITAAVAAETLTLRREARRSLTAWARVVGFEPAKHHQLIIDKLEAVSRGEIKRLAIFLPPGSAKSTYASILFPPWYLAQRDNSSILAASHNKDLADKFGRQCRNLIDQHGNALGYELRKDSQAADDWAISTGSIYFCAGVGGRIAGHRADLGIVDDPVGSIDDADSQTVRDSVWEWWTWNFLPRLKPGACVVVISTRWHEDDLMGRLLAAQPGRWEVISIPMEAEDGDVLGRRPGERLWPEYFTDEMVSEAKENSRKWMSAYQQRPSPEQGDFFKKEWIIYYDPQQLPKHLSNYCASDHACSEKQLQQNDSNLLVPFGVDEGHNVWVYPDVWWQKNNTGVTVRAMLDMMKRREPLAWIAESEHITKSIKPFLVEKMLDEGLYIHLEEFHGGKSKTAKAAAIQGMFEMRKVYLPKAQPWTAKMEHELLTFPIGVHDEWPDVLGVIGRFIQRMIRPQKPKPQKEVPYLTYGWLKQRSKAKDLQEELIREGVN
jgi:hypothetical protein